MGLPTAYDVCPAVIEELSNDVNVSIGFFAGAANNQKVSIEFEARKNFVRLGRSKIEMITELHEEEGQVMSSNASEVIQTLGLPETCLQNKSEAGTPVYNDQLRLISPNSMQFVRVNTKEKVGPTEVIFEPEHFRGK